MNCINCGKAHSDYRFRVLRVETLHVRDLGGEKRVQALGDFEEHSVCRACAEAKLAALSDTRQAMKKACLPFAVLTLAGPVVAAVFWNSEPVIRLFGLAMMVCGVMGLYGGIRNTTAKKRELSVLGKEAALERCAWEVFLEAAPKKNDVNDITYIPVNAETLARKNGDLMILYDLLPEIAIEAHKRIHGIEA